MPASRISARQFMLITIHCTIGTTILIGASPVTYIVNQDGWIASVLGITLNLLSVLLYNWIGTRMNGLRFSQFIEQLLGKWIGRLLLLIVLSYVLLLAALLIRVVGGFMTTHIISDTPIEVIQLLFAFVAVIAVRMGVENLARTTEIFSPWVMLFLLSMFILLLPKLDLHNMQPILEAAPQKLTLATFYYFSLQEQVVLLFLFPYVAKSFKAAKALLVGTAIGGLLVCIVTLFSILVLGADVTGTMLYPSYTLAKMIDVGDFLQRIEAVLALLWLVMIFVKLTVCLYASCEIVSHVLGMSTIRTATFPVGIAAVVLSVSVYESAAEFVEFTPKTWSVFSFIFCIIIPVGIALISLMRPPKTALKPSA